MQHTRNIEQVATEQAAPQLWRYLYPSRPDDEELAYRQHFLVNDVRQVATAYVAITTLLAAMSINDISNISDQPDLAFGASIKMVFLTAGVMVAWTILKFRTPKILDRGVIAYTLMFALGIVITHMISPDYTPARIATLVVTFIFTGLFAFPVYATVMVPSILVLILGDGLFLFATDRIDLLQDRPVILIVYAFSVFMSSVASALHHRSRYGVFHALRQVNTLSGIVPICANCKKIRNDSGYYQQIEQFISEHSDAVFSHGMCPECSHELYPDVRLRKD